MRLAAASIYSESSHAAAVIHHDVESFPKKLFWPMFVDKDIESAYRQYKEVMSQKSTPLSALSYCLFFFIFLAREIVHVSTPVQTYDESIRNVYKAATILAVTAFIFAFSYLATFIFTDIRAKRIRNMLLSVAIILCNASNGLSLVARCMYGNCKPGDSRFSCVHNPEALPFYQGAAVFVGLFYSCVIGRNVLNFSFLLFIYSMGFSALLYSALIVYGRSPGFIGVLIQCVLMYGLILGSSYKDMTVFEYYYAAQKQFQDEILESNKLASLERYQLKMILANVAHDLKTPLVAFTAGVHTIIKSLKCVPRDMMFNTVVDEIRETSLEMEASCVFMTSQINRAIDVSKSEHNVKLIGKYESVGILETVNWAVNIIKVVSHKVRITVCGTLSTTNWCAITDKCWMQDNLLCLLSNAVKYSPEESHICIHLNVVNKAVEGCHESPDNSDLTTTHKYLLIEVEDHGIGVPPDRCGQLFRPFSQAQRRTGGTGLGLYSMALRIHALNGFCGIRSAEGHSGSVFYFGVPFSEDLSALENSEISAGLGGPSFISKYDSTLSSGSERCGVGSTVPEVAVALSVEDENEMEIIKMDPPLSRGMSGRSSLSTGANSYPIVLIVDDAPPVLKLVGRVLSQEGCVVHTAADGFRALTMMKERLYTLVIMDIQMPLMDGIESVRELREWESVSTNDRSQQYILGASANPDEDTKNEAIAVGMNEFTTKPVSLSKLVSLIRGLHSPI